MKLHVFAWRNVFRNQRRTLVTAGIFCIGTLALLLTAGYMFATFYGLRELTIGSEFGHIQIGQRGEFDAQQVHGLESGLPPAALKQLQQALQTIDGMRFAMPRIYFEGLVSNGEQTFAIQGQGIDPSREDKLSSLYMPIVQGSSFAPDAKESTAQIMLAAGLAARLGVQPGGSVTLLATTEDGALNALDLTVAGVYSTGVPERDLRALTVPVATAQQLLRSDKVSRLIVVLADTESTDSVSASLQRALPAFEVKTWSDLAYFYHRVVRLYGNVFSIFGLILLAVILLSAINAMSMNVNERVRETGTFRALGITQGQLQGAFVLEGAMIAALGAALGLVLGALLSIGINMAEIPLSPPPGRNTAYPLSILLRLDFSCAVFFAMIALGGFSAWLPARRAVRLPVVQALHHV